MLISCFLVDVLFPIRNSFFNEQQEVIQTVNDFTSMAHVALRSHFLSLPLALGAGFLHLLHEAWHYLLLFDDDPLTIALGTDFYVVWVVGTRPSAMRTQDPPCIGYFHLLSYIDVLQSHLYLYFSSSPSLLSLLLESSPSKVSEYVSKNVPKRIHSSTSLLFFDTLFPTLIVLSSLVRIRQHFISSRQILELGHSSIIIRVLVRVVFQGQLPIGLLYLRRARIFLHFQDGIEVSASSNH
mmetsp:Transcript_35310/g.34317  ORF Transcript_35310/g.34317 Transcript_35310/m.34317 type:complete len:239 (-) Transcript_35310:144-860(-)